MSDHPGYAVVVVGGGPAGLTTALYATRLGHRTAVFEKEGGRHARVGHVHNVLGVSEDVSGSQLAELGVRQLETYGADFYPDAVERVRRLETDGEGDERTSGAGADEGDGATDGERRFRLEAAHATVDADRIVFATGFTDRAPEVPGLLEYTGRGLHYCLHCDAYTLGDAPVYVLGHGESAAHVAMTMLNVTDDVDLLLDGREPEWSDETDRQLRAHPVDRIDVGIVDTFPEGEGSERADEPWLGGFEFADGAERDYRGGFAMYGKEYNAELAEQLGCALTDEGAIDVDERGETSVDGAYAVGDVTHGQNQTTIAVGDGARAGIAIDKDLRRYPRPLAELEGEAPGASGDGSADGGDQAADDPDGSDAIDPETDVPGSPADLRARMRRVRERETYPGLREPRPNR